jgi:hypothetical protein
LLSFRRGGGGGGGGGGNANANANAASVDNRTQVRSVDTFVPSLRYSGVSTQRGKYGYDDVEMML